MHVAYEKMWLAGGGQKGTVHRKDTVAPSLRAGRRVFYVRQYGSCFCWGGFCPAVGVWEVGSDVCYTGKHSSLLLPCRACVRVGRHIYTRKYGSFLLPCREVESDLCYRRQYGSILLLAGAGQKGRGLHETIQ